MATHSRIPATARHVLKRAHRWLTFQLGRSGWLRPVLELAVRWTNRRRPWMRAHPFDAEHGVLTTSFVPGWLLGAGHAHSNNHGYGGCQPSCLRRVLSTIPDPARYAFLDIGCGKGRGLIVASELPFRKVVGLEIDAALSRVARTNAAAVGLRFPGRTPIEVVQGDAATFVVPDGDLVVFIYHAFSVELLRQVLARLLEGSERHSLYVVYEYPEFGHLLDAEPRLRRWFAETVLCEPSEVGVGSGSNETAVCWSWKWESAPSCQGADAVIDTTEGVRLHRPETSGGIQS